jgi:UDP-N-acetylglucosamine 2-epimerase
LEDMSAEPLPPEEYSAEENPPEETTVLGVPCITIRENTERPVTVTLGTNFLAGTDPVRILSAAEVILAGNVKKARSLRSGTGSPPAGSRMCSLRWHYDLLIHGSVINGLVRPSSSSTRLCQKARYNNIDRISLSKKETC